MALTKRTEIGSREFLADGQCQVRVDTVIEEDGRELSRTHHRHVLAPGDLLAAEPDSVKRVALAAWTPEVVAAYKAAKAAREAARA